MSPERTEGPPTDVGGGAERRSNAIRDRIVAAAAQLLGELGYAATTMERVAGEAKVARATVFNYFASKELLVDAVTTQHYIGFGDYLRLQPDSTTDFRTQITDALSRWAMSFAQDADNAVAIVRAWVHAGGPYLPGSDATADRFDEMIRAEQERGRIRADASSIVLGRALSDALTGTMLRWTSGEHPTPEALRHALLETADAIDLD